MTWWPVAGSSALDNQYLQGLSKQQRQKILGVRNNQQYEQGGDWQKLLPNWKGLGKQGSRLDYAQLYKIPEMGTDVTTEKYPSTKPFVKDFKSVKILNSKYDLRISDNVRLKPKMLKELEIQLNQAIKLMGIKNLDEFPQIIIAADKDLGGALGSYVAVENKLYMNSLLLDKKKREHYLSLGNNLGAKYRLATVVHELFHWKDAMDYVHKYGKITDQKEFVEAIREYHRPKVDKLVKKGYNIEDISNYAYKSLLKGKYDEVMTEYRTLQLLERSGKK